MKMSEAPIFQEDMISDLLCQLDTHRSMGPDGIHPRVMWEPTKVFTKTLSIICQQSCITGEVPAGWRLANVTPIYKNGWKDDLGNYRSVSLTSAPGKVSSSGRDHPVCHYVAHAGQPRDQAQTI